MQIEWVVVSNDLFKKCLFDSTDTKRNSKEWSRKVVDCLKIKIKEKSLQQQHDEKTTDLCSLHFETAVTAMGRILSTLRLVCWPQPEECVVRRASSTELYVDNTTVSYVQTSSL